MSSTKLSPRFTASTRLAATSRPTTSWPASAKATPRGNPTYPSPTIPIFTIEQCRRRRVGGEGGGGRPRRDRLAGCRGAGGFAAVPGGVGGPERVLAGLEPVLLERPRAALAPGSEGRGPAPHRVPHESPLARHTLAL